MGNGKELLVKLFVIGATGRTGQEIVQQALARNHHVTAFVRLPESITLQNERLSVLKGMPWTKTNFSELYKITMRWCRLWDREKSLNRAQCSMIVLLQPLEQ